MAANATEPGGRGARRPMICVYCGSRLGAREAYAETARATGRAVAAAGWGLIYGAGDAGLMGTAARSALEAGAPVLGFIPRRLIGREAANDDLTATVVTETMHERKKLMMENADAVLALPGGIGTLDELVEAITWRQLEIVDKPVILVDAGGYWRPFLALVDHLVAEGFADASLTDLFEVAEGPEAAIARLEGRLAPRP
ncbi:MAG: TIGR00730 family Rossman fold protein [Pseudomonadota bacterium]